MKTIEEIASAHLGKAGDGSVVKPYVTPDFVDPSLLVAVPRVLNRVQYDIKENALPFAGYDVWNCYEFSTLLDNGYPLSGMLKIVYPSNSESIVESKSLKLYLNSYNMARVVDNINTASVAIASKVSNDLQTLLKCKVDVSFHRQQSHMSRSYTNPLTQYFWHIDEVVDYSKLSFEAYNETPALLKVVAANPASDTRFHTSSLRSNCRVTNQPDWGDVFVYMKGDRAVSPDSLLQYIISMRKENHFHEEICECIYKRLWDLLQPDELFVACLYTRRGGIDINPVRGSSDVVIQREAHHLLNSTIICEKTMRQ